MIRATFAVLAGEFDGRPGIACRPVRVSPRGVGASPGSPEAQTLEPLMFLLRGLPRGWAPDPRPRLLRYRCRDRAGAHAMFDRGWQIDGFTVRLFADQSAVTAADVIELWVAEGVLPRAEAERRVAEAMFVAIDRDGRPIGVSTAYLRHNSQLRAELWFYRAFVAPVAHRSLRRRGRARPGMGRDRLSSPLLHGRGPSRDRDHLRGREPGPEAGLPRGAMAAAGLPVHRRERAR